MNDWMNPEGTPEKRAALLLAEMGDEEKLTQLQCLFARIPDDGMIAEQCPLGVGDVSALRMRECLTLEEAAAFQREAQRKIMERSPHHIPAIFHMEGICGPMLQDSTSFPSGIARGAGFDPELEERIGEIVGEQEAACGVTQVFAPVLDIASDPRLGRMGESYGEDPVLVGQMGSAYTRGIQKTAVDGRHPEAVAKHFAAFHRGAGGIHGAWVDISERSLREIYTKGFQAAITTAGLKGVMPCYCLINGLPAHGNAHLLREILREEMGFDSLVVSDYCGLENMHTQQYLAASLEEAGIWGLEAGVDQETPSVSCYSRSMLEILRARPDGMALLSESVLRVLTAKFRMGLFEHPFALEGEALSGHFRRKEQREVSLQAARQGQVLLKNDGILPLRRGAHPRIALIGCHAGEARYFFGGYTHLSMTEGTYARLNTMGGVEALPWQSGEYEPIPGTKIQSADTELFLNIFRRQQPSCRSLLEELRLRLPEAEITWVRGYPMAGDDCSGHGEAMEAARKSDLILMTLGGRYGSCSVASMAEGVDATDINLPPCQDRLIEKLSALGKPMVGIHFNGRPISSDAADRHLNAILEAWTLSETGAQAIADTLTGENNPSGRLPVTVACNAGQLPMIYNHPNGSSWHQSGSIGFQNYVDAPHTPRYPFGFGLSYTQFAYRDLKLSRREVLPDEPLEISFTLENTGSRAGTEVVQLYVRDCFASVARPVQELAGFRRITLSPGESTEVRFSLNPGFLAFLDRRMEWKTEAGEAEVMVGSSSADLPLRGSFRVLKDQILEGRNRPLWAEALSAE